MPITNPAKTFVLAAELTVTEENDIRARLAYEENIRIAVMLLLNEVASLREEVNVLKGV